MERGSVSCREDHGQCLFYWRPMMMRSLTAPSMIWSMGVWQRITGLILKKTKRNHNNNNNSLHIETTVTCNCRSDYYLFYNFSSADCFWRNVWIQILDF